MTSTRQEKMSRLLQKELGEILRQESVTSFRNAMVTVTVVRVSPDLGSAKIYVSIFAPSQDRSELFKKLQDMTGMLRGRLGEKIKKQVRVIPSLHFYLDDSLDYYEKIEKLLGD